MNSHRSNFRQVLGATLRSGLISNALIRVTPNKTANVFVSLAPRFLANPVTPATWFQTRTHRVAHCNQRRDNTPLSQNEYPCNCFEQHKGMRESRPVFVCHLLRSHLINRRRAFSAIIRSVIMPSPSGRRHTYNQKREHARV